MAKDPLNNRRNFIKNIITLGATVALAPQMSQAEIAVKNDNRQENGFTVLFQGDSITDGNRSRNNDWNHVMGHGYQYIIASKLWFDLPNKGFHFFNRGVSGNTVKDLAARWQKDTLEIKPDLLSILIGINDASAWINGNENATVPAYESGYQSLLQQTKDQLPGVRLVLCEPFILPVGKVKEKWEIYLSEVQQRQAIVKSLAVEFDAVHVAFQSAFDKALKKAPAGYWIWDGIHPMPAGHELMAREWMRVVDKKFRFNR